MFQAAVHADADRSDEALPLFASAQERYDQYMEEAGGPGPFRYLLYKDVNRQVRLTDPSGGPAGGRAW